MSVFGSAAITNEAEIFYAGSGDSDSTPGNGPQLPVPEDDEASETVTPTVGGGGTPAPTVPAFVCETKFFQVLGNRLNELDPAIPEYTPIGAAQLGYNATGYNVYDNYIYGIGNNTAANNQLVRIGADGSQQILLDLGHKSYQGDMNRLNELLYRHSGTVKAVNVSTGTQRNVMTGAPGLGDDFVHRNTGVEGTVIGLAGGKMVVLDLDTELSDAKTLLGDITVETSNTYGAVWAGSGQRIFMFNNGSGNIYYSDDWETAVTPTTVLVGNAGANGGNDGMSCALAPAPTVTAIVTITFLRIRSGNARRLYCLPHRYDKPWNWGYI